MKKIKAKITPGASNGASGVILFEVRQVIWCSYLEIGVLVPLRFGIIDTEGFNGNGLHTLIL